MKPSEDAAKAKETRYKSALLPKKRSEIVAILGAMMDRETDSSDEVDKDYDIETVLHLLKKDNDSLNWLFRVGLFPQTKICPKCQEKMSFSRPYAEHPSGSFTCAKCNVSISPRTGTLLGGSRLPDAIFIRLMIGWLRHENYSALLKTYGISSKTLSHLNDLLNHFSKFYLEHHSEKIGGYLHVVEIDEALIHRRKRNVGRLKEEGWVIGGIERPTNPTDPPKLFLKLCEDRKQETLEQIIKQWVLPGTIIITDSFASYKRLSELGYYHFTVNHSKNFVDPTTQAHTQRIEGEWHHVRGSALPRTGCRIADVDLYLSGYLYRRRTKQSLKQLVEDIKSLSSKDVEEIFAQRKKHSDTKAKLKEEKKKQMKEESADQTPKSFEAGARAEERAKIFMGNSDKTAVSLVQATRTKDRKEKLEILRETTHPSHVPPRYNTRASRHPSAKKTQDGKQSRRKTKH